MDLSNLDLELASAEGIEVKIHHPVNGDTLMQANGEPVSIRIYGTESKEFKAQARIQRGKFKGKVDMDSDQFNQSMIEVLVKCTVSWTGIEWEGAPLECTEDNVRKLYNNGGFSWLVKQLLAASGDSSLIPLGQGNG